MRDRPLMIQLHTVAAFALSVISLLQHIFGHGQSGRRAVETVAVPQRAPPHSVNTACVERASNHLHFTPYNT